MQMQCLSCDDDVDIGRCLCYCLVQCEVQYLPACSLQGAVPSLFWTYGTLENMLMRRPCNINTDHSWSMSSGLCSKISLVEAKNPG
jgi:hypothetical protein